jgi:hypothetical protein
LLLLFAMSCGVMRERWWREGRERGRWWREGREMGAVVAGRERDGGNEGAVVAGRERGGAVVAGRE